MKVVLAYSGGLDTSVILRWLIEEKGAEVVAYTADVGQGEEVESARLKALATGATEAIVGDLRDRFVEEAVFPALRAGAVYERQYLLGTALARPIIASGLVDAARSVGADAVSHGATGKGNDQVRFELATAALAPDLETIAPWREWDLNGRADLMEYAAAHGIEVPTTPRSPYSMDANLFHISYEGGVLEDPWVAPDADMFRMTTDPVDAPDAAQEVVLSFEHGDPVAVDGERLDPTEMLIMANEIAGTHGVGRVDIVENRFVGMKSRGVYETPGGTLLHTARRALETIVLDREVLRIRDGLSDEYATVVYNGFWYSPERVALQKSLDMTVEDLTGDVRLRAYKGSLTVTGRRSPNSRYNADVVTFEADDVYDQMDAAGFIRLNSLRIRGRGDQG